MKYRSVVCSISALGLLAAHACTDDVPASSSEPTTLDAADASTDPIGPPIDLGSASDSGASADNGTVIDALEAEDGAQAGPDLSGAEDEPLEPDVAGADGGELEEVDTGPAEGTAAACFENISGGVSLDYDQFGPVVGSHCLGTNHQDIAGVERVVFLGDSVTAGTPPTPFWQYYRNLLTLDLRNRFGDIDEDNCSEWGARTDDLLIGQHQVDHCFADGGDERTTLVVMTIGGNDIAAWAQDQLSAEEALAEADAAADLLDEAIGWFFEAGRFPNGVFVIYANPYEYTDATGDVSSCPASVFAGLEGNWIEGAPAVVHLQQRFMEIAVTHQVDMIFTLEHFCGHGFHHDDPTSQCYRGPNAEIWFDFTCIHPNPTGHAVIADMFMAVVEE